MHKIRFGWALCGGVGYGKRRGRDGGDMDRKGNDSIGPITSVSGGRLGLLALRGKIKLDEKRQMLS